METGGGSIESVRCVKIEMLLACGILFGWEIQFMPNLWEEGKMNIYRKREEENKFLLKLIRQLEEEG